MSVATELEALQTNLNNAYDAIEAKGGTLPENKNAENLADAITSISSGGGVVVPVTKEAKSTYSTETTVTFTSNNTEAVTPSVRTIWSNEVDPSAWVYDDETNTQILNFTFNGASNRLVSPIQGLNAVWTINFPYTFTNRPNYGYSYCVRSEMIKFKDNVDSGVVCDLPAKSRGTTILLSGTKYYIQNLPACAMGLQVPDAQWHLTLVPSEAGGTYSDIIYSSETFSKALHTLVGPFISTMGERFKNGEALSYTTPVAILKNNEITTYYDATSVAQAKCCFGVDEGGFFVWLASTVDATSFFNSIDSYFEQFLYHRIGYYLTGASDPNGFSDNYIMNADGTYFTLDFENPITIVPGTNTITLPEAVSTSGSLYNFVFDNGEVDLTTLTNRGTLTIRQEGMEEKTDNYYAFGLEEDTTQLPRTVSFYS